MGMMGGSSELETVELTADTTLEAGEYEENIEGNGYTLALAEGTKLSGAVNDAALIIEAGAKWTVTGTGALSYLAIDKDAVIAGSQGKAATMTVDGVIEILSTGSVYEGEIEIYSGDGDMIYPLYITDDAGEITIAEDADVMFSGELSETSLTDFTFASKTHGLLDLKGETDGFFVIGGEKKNIDAADVDILPEIQEKLDFEGFNSTLTGWTAPAISITGGANAIVEGVYADSDYHVMEIGGSEAGSDTIVVYRNTYLDRRTFDGETIGDASWCHTTSLFARGNVRMSMSVGSSQTYYYGTAAVVDGWSAMATDSASSGGVDVMIYNSFARNLLGGYGTYADTNCRVFLYGTDFRSAEFGGIIANNGEIYVTDSQEAVTDTNTLRAEVSAPYQSFASETLEPLAYAEEDDILVENTASACLAFRNGIMMHVPDLMGNGGKINDKPGVLYVKNATLGTSLDCAPEDWETGGYAQSWIDMADEATWAWIEHTLGSAILVRSDSAVIKLTNADIRSWSGVILQTILNADAHGNFIAADEEVNDYIGVWLDVDGDTALVGDILHEDYQRTMYVALSDSASLTGDIFTGTVDDWHAAFADYADSGAEYYRDQDGYDKIWGTYVTLNEGTTWTVTGQSNITGLTVAEGATLNGIVTIDGVETDIQPGVSYEGDIRITASASASGEAAYEVTNENFGSYVSYIRKYMTAYEANGFDEDTREMALGELDAVEIGSDVYAFPFDMYVNEFGAMTFDEFMESGSGASEEPESEEEFNAYVAYLRDYMASYNGEGTGDGFDEDSRSMALAELDNVAYGSSVNGFPFVMFVNEFGAASYAEFIAKN
ncbi:MAG: hypothetical protein ACI3W7_06665 [Oscillospiraceae bacterium]